MTREEKINIAASKYIEDNSVRGAVCISNHKDSFIEGADWADEHPKEGLVALSQVWHDASEIPRDDSLIIVQSIYGDILLQRFANRKSSMVSIQRWAYIDDLLPRIEKK